MFHVYFERKSSKNKKTISSNKKLSTVKYLPCILLFTSIYTYIVYCIHHCDVVYRKMHSKKYIYFTGAIRTTCILDLETKPHYWLTVCAQDQAVVPLYSCVEVKFFFQFVFLLSVKNFFFLGFFVDKTFPISDILNYVQQCSHYCVSSFPLRHMKKNIYRHAHYSQD